ncbi:hypothetical protein [Micromonospora sp. KC721]|nr:hypothetical protein [Micromonospora sp. KC721]
MKDISDATARQLQVAARRQTRRAGAVVGGQPSGHRPAAGTDEQGEVTA